LRDIIASKYISWGITRKWVLKVLKIPSSSYAYRLKPRFFIENRTGRKVPGYSVKNNLEIIEDGELRNILRDMYNCDDPQDERYYLKTLGSKKASQYLKNEMGIRINHKKVYRLRKEEKLTRRYEPTYKHPVKRSKDRQISESNKLWEADIKFIHTDSGNVALLDIIDVFDRDIVGTYIGYGCKATDFAKTLIAAIKNRNATPENLVIRTDNGSQFRAKIIKALTEEFGIFHEFGIKHNPDSQAFIESQHGNLQREFVSLNYFIDAEDIKNKYSVYLNFYRNFRPHGSLNYLTPVAFQNNSKFHKTVLVKK